MYNVHVHVHVCIYMHIHLQLVQVENMEAYSGNNTEQVWAWWEHAVRPGNTADTRCHADNADSADSAGTYCWDRVTVLIHTHNFSLYTSTNVHVCVSCIYNYTCTCIYVRTCIIHVWVVHEIESCSELHVYMKPTHTVQTSQGTSLNMYMYMYIIHNSYTYHIIHVRTYIHNYMYMHMAVHARLVWNGTRTHVKVVWNDTWPSVGLCN